MNQARRVMLLCAAVLGLASTASAGSITLGYEVAAWGPVTLANQGQPGDTIALTSHSGSLTLEEGIATIAKVNTLLFDVNYTYPQGQFPLSVTRDVTISIGCGRDDPDRQVRRWLHVQPQRCRVAGPRTNHHPRPRRKWLC